MTEIEDMHPWTLYALEVTKDRERQLKLQRLVAEGRAEQTNRPSRLHRPAALILAALSRGSASASGA
jgi:hypothetical protein